jgi:hypothetical protein
MYSSSYEIARQAAITALDTYLAAALQKARILHTRDEGIATLTKAVEVTSDAYDRAARALNESSPAAVQTALQVANDAASAFEKADAALKKAVKGPVVRDEAAILAALDALDAALLAVSVAARKAAAADDGSGDTYDLHADAEYAIRRVFDLTN